MEVSLDVAGSTVATTQLGGPLFVAPEGTRLDKTRPEGALLRWAPAPGEIPPDVLVGSLPLIWWDRSTRTTRVDFLKVPPPEPFAADDLGLMWHSVLESSLPLAQSIPIQGRAHGHGVVSGTGFSVEALPAAVDLAGALLSEWPTRDSTQLIWRPPDAPGGREDAALTDRLGGRGLGTRGSTGTLIPDLVARRIGVSSEWGATNLAAVADALAAGLADRQVTHDDEMEQPIRLLEEVSIRANRAAHGVAPPLSSWPHLAQTTYRAMLEALVSVSAAGSGVDSVPLCDLWRLYESWICLRTAEALSNGLGRGQVLDLPWWANEWVIDGVFVRLHAQATVGQIPDPRLCGHPNGVRSVSSNLRPDVLVAVWKPDGGQVFICVDAKQRTAETQMEASQVAATGSKYLWGIRDAVDVEALPVATTLVASSAPVTPMHDPARSRIAPSWITPSRGDDTFESSLLRSVEEAISALAPS